MDIQGYIIDHWKSKMDAEHPVLVVYDKDGVYQELLPLAQDEGLIVCDTSKDILQARLNASRIWCNELSLNSDARMIVYRKCAMPSNDRNKVTDPFAAFCQSGKLFPVGAQDRYDNLCKAFLPNKIDELDKLFDSGSTSFSMINALLDGAAYPELELLTGGKSFMEITIGVLALSECNDQKWLREWQQFASVQFPGLDANCASLKEVQQKLWAYLLFSEFVFDLPEKLPASLDSVAKAPEEMKEKVYLICDKLRNRMDLNEDYVVYSNKIASQLDLPTAFAKSRHLGERVTFCFENSVEYDRFIDLLKEGLIAEASSLLSKNEKGVWCQYEREVKVFWKLAQYALDLLDCINRGMKADCSLNELVSWYAESGCKADAAFRQYHTKLMAEAAPPSQVKQLTEIVNDKYIDFTGRSVAEYQKLIGQVKDCPALKNQGCVQYVYPALKEGKRVVLAFVDAFRYEMGAIFADSIGKQYKDRVKCEPRISYLPSVTRFGMANHLDDICAVVQDGVLNPMIGAKSVVLPGDRIEYLKQKTGTEVVDVRLEDFDSASIPSSTKLLVVRSTGIDTAGEKSKLSGLPLMDGETVKLFKMVEECKKLNFDLAVLVADHGFMLQPKFDIGNLIPKPAGSDVILGESRLLVGNLNDSSSTLSFAPSELGVTCDAMKMCYAKNFTVFTKGEVYYHEGLSLQENVVPIVTIDLQEKSKKMDFKIDLYYKGKSSGTVYNCRPLIDISTSFSDLFADDANVKLTVAGDDGKIVGVPEGKFYNEITCCVTIPSGATQIRQPISIDEEYHGSTITVTALNAETNATLSKITLNYEND